MKISPASSTLQWKVLASLTAVASVLSLAFYLHCIGFTEQLQSTRVWSALVSSTNAYEVEAPMASEKTYSNLRASRVLKERRGDGKQACSSTNSRVVDSFSNSTFALVSMNQHDMELVKQLSNLTGFCHRSIYSSGLTEDMSCNATFVLTQQPFRMTHAYLDVSDFVAAVVLVQHPFQSIMSTFLNDFQLSITQNAVDSDIFTSYVSSKADLWSRYVNFWIAKSNAEHSVHFIELDEFDDFDSERLNADLMGLQNDSNCTSNLTYSDRHDFLTYQSLEAVDRINALSPFLLQHLICDRVSETLRKLENFGISWDNTPLSRRCNKSTTITQDSKLRVNLLTTLFESSMKERQIELDYALTRNYLNPNIDSLHLWLESGMPNAVPSAIIPTDPEKFKIVPTDKQPMYSDFFTYANTHLMGQIVIIQNSDIFWPDKSIELMVQNLKPGMVFALSRHSNITSEPDTMCYREGKHNANYCLGYVGSHDAFAFIPPIDPMIIRNLHFKQNTWGAENYVLEALKYGGWQVWNPCMEIISVHSHCSGYRPHTGFAIGIPMQGKRTSGSARRSPPVLLSEMNN